MLSRAKNDTHDYSWTDPVCCRLYRGLYQMVPDYGSPARSSRLFSEGSHYIEYRAVDAAGNVDTCSFTVTVHGRFTRHDSRLSAVSVN